MTAAYPSHSNTYTIMTTHNIYDDGYERRWLEPIGEIDWNPCRVINGKSIGYTLTDSMRWVDRRTPFGNPFVVGKHGEQGECVELYRKWIWESEQHDLREKMRRELRGMCLICHCKPDPCHADVIFEIANNDGRTITQR